MLRILKNLIFISFVLTQFLFQYFQQKIFFKNETKLNRFLQLHEKNLSKRDIYRLKDYAIRISAWFFCIFNDVLGYKFTRKSKQFVTMFSAFIPLYDDFSDHHELNKEQMKMLFRNPFSFSPANNKEKAILDLLNVLNEVAGEKWIKENIRLIYKVHMIQYHSKYQKDVVLSSASLEKITHMKGGYALLLVRKIIDKPVEDKEFNLYFQIGAFMQWIDDVFDIRSDLAEGIKTPVNQAQNLNEIRFLYEKVYYNAQQAIAAYSRLSVRQGNPEYWLFLIYLTGATMINQYLRLQKIKGPDFSFANLSKKDTELNLLSLSNLVYMLKKIVTFHPLKITEPNAR